MSKSKNQPMVAQASVYQAKPTSFRAIETIDEQKKRDRLISCAKEFLQKFGYSIEHYVPAFEKAIEEIKKGASIELAVEAETGVSWNTWQKLEPGLIHVFEQALAVAGVGAEQSVYESKPDVWLKQVYSDRWTPKEKKEHTGAIGTYASEMDEEAIVVAAEAIKRKRNSGATEGA